MDLSKYNFRFKLPDESDVTHMVSFGEGTLGFSGSTRKARLSDAAILMGGNVKENGYTPYWLRSVGVIDNYGSDSTFYADYDYITGFGCRLVVQGLDQIPKKLLNNTRRLSKNPNLYETEFLYYLGKIPPPDILKEVHQLYDDFQLQPNGRTFTINDSTGNDPCRPRALDEYEYNGHRYVFLPNKHDTTIKIRGNRNPTRERGSCRSITYKMDC